MRLDESEEDVRLTEQEEDVNNDNKPVQAVDIAFNPASGDWAANVEAIRAARCAGVLPLIVGLDISSSCVAAELAQACGTYSYYGIHPLSRVPEAVDAVSFCSRLTAMSKTVRSRIVAIGECGLDFFRADNYEEQTAWLAMQLQAAAENHLPCFLHCRAAYAALNACLEAAEPVRGVVHSFDGTAEEAHALLARGLYIGLNGCSMRAPESIAVVRSLPLERILVETDSPYCLIRRSYAAAAFVEPPRAKENKPSLLWNIIDAIAAIKGVAREAVAAASLANTVALFGIPVLKS